MKHQKWREEGGGRRGVLLKLEVDGKMTVETWRGGGRNSNIKLTEVYSVPGP